MNRFHWERIDELHVRMTDSNTDYISVTVSFDRRGIAKVNYQTTRLAPSDIEALAAGLLMAAERARQLQELYAANVAALAVGDEVTVYVSGRPTPVHAVIMRYERGDSDARVLVESGEETGSYYQPIQWIVPKSISARFAPDDAEVPALVRTAQQAIDGGVETVYALPILREDMADARDHQQRHATNYRRHLVEVERVADQYTEAIAAIDAALSTKAE